LHLGHDHGGGGAAGGETGGNRCGDSPMDEFELVPLLRADADSECGAIVQQRGGGETRNPKPVFDPEAQTRRKTRMNILNHDAGIINTAAKPTRRRFVQSLGAGLLIVVSGERILGQATGEGTTVRRQRPARVGGTVDYLSSRFHISKEGVVTVMTGKVECGQGARAELSQAAAEELCVPVEMIQLIMADTGIVPDDGGTFASRTTPQTVPVVRQGAAAVRNILITIVSQKWEVPRNEIQTQDGKLTHSASGREISYGDLVEETATTVFAQTQPAVISMRAVKDWKVLGTAVPRPNRRDLVTGSHYYPSDISLPGMMYGKVLRPPSFGAKLVSIDVSGAAAMKDVLVVRDGDFLGVTAPTSFLASQAIEVLGKTAVWQTQAQISSKDLFSHLRAKVVGGEPENPFAEDLAGAAKAVRQVYHVSYIQHAP